MHAFVFPGQGSQHVGMGQELFDTVPEFLDLETDIDELLGYSLRQICLENPNDVLKVTQYTQPCLYVVNALHYLNQLGKSGHTPDYVAGHSLGEYSALFAAGAYDLLTGLRLVIKRGELMSQAQGGGMAAVIGLDPETIVDILENNNSLDITIANYNTPLQTVLSGSKEAIERATSEFEKAGAQLYIPLPVSGAFHSRAMFHAAEEFATFLNSFEFNELHMPVIANVTGHPYPTGEATKNISSLLVQQITQPVQWTNSIRYLISQGINSFEEVGPGMVLSRLIKQMQQEPKLV